MIRLKKLLIMFSVSLLLISVTYPIYSPAYNSLKIKQYERSDNFEWIYKVIDGKLYRRLFNVTAQKWAGDWEPAF